MCGFACLSQLRLLTVLHEVWRLFSAEWDVKFIMSSEMCWPVFNLDTGICFYEKHNLRVTSAWLSFRSGISQVYRVDQGEYLVKS